MPMPNKATGTGQHSYEVRGDDLYETPAVATRALLHFIDDQIYENSIIWEPACGPGAIVDVLHQNRKSVICSDVNDYGVPGQIVKSFFDFKYDDVPRWPKIERTAFGEKPVEGIRPIWVITNPPFKKGMAHRFRNHAMKTLHIRRVALLVRLAYLEGVGRMLDHQDGTMSKVIIFSRRLPMMHRHGWEGPTNSSAMAFCWVVWDAQHEGPPDMEFVDWKEFE